MIRKNKKLEKKFNPQEELLNIVEKHRNEIIQRGTDWVYQESFDLKGRQPKEETKKLVAKLIVSCEEVWRSNNHTFLDEFIKYVAEYRGKMGFRMSTLLRGFLSFKKGIELILKETLESSKDRIKYLEVISLIDELYENSIFKLADVYQGIVEKELSKKTQSLQEKLDELEESRRALINMLEDTEESRREVEEEQNKTRATLVSLTDGLIVFDRENKITLLNPEAERILELKESQVLNKRIDQISGFPNLAQLYQILGQKIKWTGQKYELILEKPLTRFFQVSIAPAVVEKETVGLIVILHDVTREKEIDRLKTEFVSIAAHQLRTPLSSIKWILRMILDGDVGEISKDQTQLLEKGYESNERMISLINDLLNVARIEEGRFIYDLTLQSLEEIIEKTIDTFDRLIKEKKLKLIFEKPKKPLPQVKIDKEKMELVVQNLLDNAIRFNKPGGQVTISIKYDKMNIEVMIKDNGIGIPQTQQSRIFTKFFRADNAVKSETSGTGLGLFICNNVIEAHEGRMRFESKEHQGTTFWFTLPVK